MSVTYFKSHIKEVFQKHENALKNLSRYKRAFQKRGELNKTKIDKLINACCISHIYLPK